MTGAPYTPQDIDYLRSFYGRMPLDKLAKRMKRTPQSIRVIASKHGIRIERSAMTWERLSELLGVTDDTVKWRIRTAKHDEDVLPHDRSGRYYIFYESDIMAWLRRGHVLTFDRRALHPDLQRMHDMVRRRYYTNAEIMNIDLCLRIRTTDNIKPRIYARYIGSYYDRHDVWALWYSRGHLMPHCSDPYVSAIRTAWNSTYVRKGDLQQHFSRETVRYIAKQCPGSTARGIRKDALHAYFSQRGDRDMARHFAEKPIDYMELIKEIEGRHR